jgi:hypothetical protein
MANGLVNLQTDLTSLRFTSVPLAGEKPYIVKDIGQGPLLGGTIGMEISRRIDDTSRIAQMLVDKPGINFLLKQALLQQVNLSQKLEKARSEGKTKVGAIVQQIGRTALKTAGIAASTLAQVAVNGTGTHFIYGFAGDTYYRNRYIDPEALGGDPNNPENYTDKRLIGAQLALRGEPINGTIESKFYDPFTDTLLNTSGLNVLTNNNYFPLDTVVPEGTVPQEEYVPTQDDLITEAAPPEELAPLETTYVGRKKLFNKQSRLNLGDQGAVNTPQKEIAKTENKYWYMSDVEYPNKSQEVDLINALYPRTAKYDSEQGRKKFNENSDIIKFKFNILTPEDEQVLYFRAYLDSFNDNYTGQWNPVKYLGRAEDFQIYGGFQRKIGLSFKIAAATREEMKPLYQKIILLASSTAPTYASSGQFMRGTIVKMTVGDYVYELPGVLNSVQYSWEQDYPWEIVLDSPEQVDNTDADIFMETRRDSQMQQLPTVLNCQLDFTPIHTFTPQTGLSYYITRETPSRINNFITSDPVRETRVPPPAGLAVTNTPPTSQIPIVRPDITTSPGGVRRFDTTSTLPEGINTNVGGSSLRDTGGLPFQTGL